eukprot:COSAG04_NODE_2136_length_4725_cov_8.089710_5_plen_950_part_01
MRAQTNFLHKRAPEDHLADRRVTAARQVFAVPRLAAPSIVIGSPSLIAMASGAQSGRARACFCLSKARDGAAGQGDARAGSALLRASAELEQLKPSALMRRATAAGAADGDIRGALDEEDSKAALVALIVAHEGALAEESPVTELRSELEALKASALAQRATAAGVAAEDIERAWDAAQPKEALVALVLARAPAQGEARGAGTGSAEAAAALLRAELGGMRVSALQKRAVSEGAPADAVEGAMDSDDPKAALVALVAEIASRRGPSERMASALAAGGETAAEAVSGALGNALDVLEQASVSSPRKSRRPIMELMESLEELLEAADGGWCDGVSRCGADRLGSLASAVLAVQGLRLGAAGDALSDAVPAVSSLLELLRECGSVAVQCESALSMGGESDEGVRLRALACVRGLSTAHLETVSVSEASLFDALKGHLCGPESELSCEERLSCWLSLFVLGCRNGVSVCARVAVVESMEELCASVTLLASAVGSSDMDGELRACSAAALFCLGILWESGSKCPPDVRADVEKSVLRKLKSVLGAIEKAHTAASAGKVIARMLELRLLEQEADLEDVSIGCGSAALVGYLGILHPKALVECDSEAVFGGSLALLRRVCPAPLPAEWWVSTCAEVDVTSVQLGCVMLVFGGSAKVLDQSTLESASWLGPVTAEAVHICKMNASAGLSARPAMSFLSIVYSLALLEQGARVESHAASMLESGVIEALDFACANDFSFMFVSVSSNAAGAAVALVGRNEGGKTLSGSTVAAVLDYLAIYFDPAHFRYTNPALRVMTAIHRVATVAIADANKKFMIQHNALLDTLVAGLLLDDDNPRRGQDGADALQEACAGVLHELALYGPGAVVLRSHKRTMDALRLLAESGTKVSRERAAGALFELDEEARSTKSKASAAEPGSSTSPPHIMVSYNWDHQDVILRVVSWLQAHGYLVWVDTEQMKG